MSSREKGDVSAKRRKSSIPKRKKTSQ